MRRWSDLAERVAATTRTSEKTGLLAEYLRTLDPEDLPIAVVFLTGLEDGNFPHERTFDDPTEMAEERRLAYVGLTRAEQRLYLTRAVTRRGWGEPRYGPPSRFLDDIPAELVDWRHSPGDVSQKRASIPRELILSALMR